MAGTCLPSLMSLSSLHRLVAELERLLHDGRVDEAVLDRLQRLLVLVEGDQDAGLSLRDEARTAPAMRRAVVRPEADRQHQVGIAGQRVLDVLLRLARGRCRPGTRAGSRGPAPASASPRCPARRSMAFCMSMRPTNSATLPLLLVAQRPSARRPPAAARPPRRCWCRRTTLRFDLGASESWQMTGIFAATRSSSGVIESGLTGQTAMPSKPAPSCLRG